MATGPVASEARAAPPAGTPLRVPPYAPASSDRGAPNPPGAGARRGAVQRGNERGCMHSRALRARQDQVQRRIPVRPRALHGAIPRRHGQRAPGEAPSPLRVRYAVLLSSNCCRAQRLGSVQVGRPPTERWLSPHLVPDLLQAVDQPIYPRFGQALPVAIELDQQSPLVVRKVERDLSVAAEVNLLLGP